MAMFVTLAPTTLPIVKEPCLEIEAKIPENSSGTEVPIATNVKPIIKSLTPNCFAIFEEKILLILKFEES